MLLGTLILVQSENTASSSSSIAIESCRKAGFDPLQLSCKTCDILPQKIISKCKACCQSFRGVEKRTQRYEAAVLLHFPDMSYMFPEIDELYREDTENIRKQKGSRFRVKTVNMANMMHGMMA